MKPINYPYLPEGKSIKLVSADNPFITEAYKFARESSLDKVMPGAAVIVKNGEIIGAGANGSDWHADNECERVRLNCKSGEGYDLCEGCHPKNHSEPSAIANCIELGNDPEEADLYLWGHWWFCEDCWNAMIEAGIKNTFVLDNAHVLFDKNHPDNIVGKQFD